MILNTQAVSSRTEILLPLLVGGSIAIATIIALRTFYSEAPITKKTTEYKVVALPVPIQNSNSEDSISLTPTTETVQKIVEDVFTAEASDPTDWVHVNVTEPE